MLSELFQQCPYITTNTYSSVLLFKVVGRCRENRSAVSKVQESKSVYFIIESKDSKPTCFRGYKVPPSSGLKLLVLIECLICIAAAQPASEAWFWNREDSLFLS